MVHRGAEEIEGMISEIIKKNPNTSTTGIVNRLKNDYNVKLNAESVLKFVNRMILLGTLRASKSSTGAITYFYPKEA
jgi:hypothetical protein